MMLFSIGTELERVGVVGPVCWLWTLDSSAKTRKKEDRRGFARGRSDALVSFSLLREKINYLEDECFAYLSPMRWPGIYSICFSQLDGGKDSFRPIGWGIFCLYRYRINKG